MLTALLYDPKRSFVELTGRRLTDPWTGLKENNHAALAVLLDTAKKCESPLRRAFFWPSKQTSDCAVHEGAIGRFSTSNDDQYKQTKSHECKGFRFRNTPRADGEYVI